MSNSNAYFFNQPESMIGPNFANCRGSRHNQRSIARARDRYAENKCGIHSRRSTSAEPFGRVHLADGETVVSEIRYNFRWLLAVRLAAQRYTKNKLPRLARSNMIQCCLLPRLLLRYASSRLSLCFSKFLASDVFDAVCSIICLSCLRFAASPIPALFPLTIKP
jgi:hypothetical protein